LSAFFPPHHASLFTGLLGQSTAYTALPDARDELEHVEDVQIAVDMSDPRLDIV
jgi:hypothetical protein